MRIRIHFAVIRRAALRIASSFVRPVSAFAERTFLTSFICQQQRVRASSLLIFSIIRIFTAIISAKMFEESCSMMRLTFDSILNGDMKNWETLNVRYPQEKQTCL